MEATEEEEDTVVVMVVREDLRTRVYWRTWVTMDVIRRLCLLQAQAMLARCERYDAAIVTYGSRCSGIPWLQKPERSVGLFPFLMSVRTDWMSVCYILQIGKRNSHIRRLPGQLYTLQTFVQVTI